MGGFGIGPIVETHQFSRVEFRRFKAFKTFTLHLRHFNILVGPNNAGKSTVLAAFRILAAGMRKALKWKPQVVDGPTGQTLGHIIDLAAISVAGENIFFDYDDSTPAEVTFHLSNKNRLTLYFPEQGACYLIPFDPKKEIGSPTLFRSRFNCPIGFVPILGPVEHNEPLYEKEAARLALFNYRAARNFRNIWYHYKEDFETFRCLLRETWPGMDIEPPRVEMSREKPILHMFCPEERIPREIFWAGFGFQVWCQMLTHVVRGREESLFLIDEPDIYLHSDLQRQLFCLLRNLGPDILIATHSTEIISEAEPDDIVLIDKRKTRARRIKNPTELSEVFNVLGSNLNPVLTQLAKTRRAVFVEGKDFQILGKFAQKIGLLDVSNRSKFAVIPVEGFNVDRIRALKRGVETALGDAITAAVILDRDYRSAEECQAIKTACEEFCDLVAIHERKEIENYLLVPQVLDRAVRRRLSDRARKTGEDVAYLDEAGSVLQEFAASQKSYVTSQYLAARRKFVRRTKPTQDETTTNELTLNEFEAVWTDELCRLEFIGGKEALRFFNERLQQKYGVSVTAAVIVEVMGRDEVPKDLLGLLQAVNSFASS